MPPRSADETTGLLLPQNHHHHHQRTNDDGNAPNLPWNRKRDPFMRRNRRCWWPLLDPRGLVPVCIAAMALLLWWRMDPANANADSNHQRESEATAFGTNSKYQRVQGMGFRIYTGGAPAFLKASSAEASPQHQTTLEANPECLGLASYGSLPTEEGDGDDYETRCYLGRADPLEDARERLGVMRAAVEAAFRASDPDPETLKLFVAPEFFWRGVDGAYRFEDEAPGEPSICGPVCEILKGLEEFVADERFQDWLFLFGSITAYEHNHKDHRQPTKHHKTNKTEHDSLFYNFAPIYRGYDPSISSHEGKRFLAPKGYLSTTDFMTPHSDQASAVFEELLDQPRLPPELLRLSSSSSTKTTAAAAAPTTMVANPKDTRGKYDYDVWLDYKEELDGLGYTLVEHGWLIVDGLSVSVEICLDHQLRTALTAYLADLAGGRRTLVPTSSSHNHHHHAGGFTRIPLYQAQIGIVSSAGMTVEADSLALADGGVLFLQDGLSDAPPGSRGDDDDDHGGLSFGGGTEAVRRTAYLSATEAFFEHRALEAAAHHPVYPEEEDGDRPSWKEALGGLFTTTGYPPAVVVFDPIGIAKVPLGGGAP